MTAQMCDFRFCTHQREFELDVDTSILSSPAFLGKLFLDVLNSVLEWIVSEEKPVIDIVLAFNEGSDIVTNNKLVVLDPFDRDHNVAKVITSKQGRKTASLHSSIAGWSK
eukprot:m.106528 g.106528  ORF g.106528 m.106528 type:complete len:110 (-) comp12674_c0_seq10:513-842(-)